MGFRAGRLEVGVVVRSVDVVSGLFHHQHNRAFAMDREGTHAAPGSGEMIHGEMLRCDYKRARKKIGAGGRMEDEEQVWALAGD